MSVSSVTCPPTPGSVRSAPWTEETDELGRGELTNSLSTRSLPPLPNCRCAGHLHPRHARGSPKPPPVLFVHSPIVSVPALLVIEQELGKRHSARSVYTGHPPRSRH